MQVGIHGALSGFREYTERFSGSEHARSIRNDRPRPCQLMPRGPSPKGARNCGRGWNRRSSARTDRLQRPSPAMAHPRKPVLLPIVAFPPVAGESASAASHEKAPKRPTSRASLARKRGLGRECGAFGRRPTSNADQSSGIARSAAIQSVGCASSWLPAWKAASARFVVLVCIWYTRWFHTAAVCGCIMRFCPIRNS